MYTPPAFEMSDPDALNAVMRAYDFAILLVPGEPDLAATHVPLKLSDEAQILYGHVARANPLCAAIEAGKEAMAIFSGPSAYISPTWYSDPDNNVPTWNYITVHAFGTLAALDGIDAERSLSNQVADFESDWRITNLDAKKRARMEAAILPFEFAINRIEGKSKLSQNKPVAERMRLAEALNERGESAIAYHMVGDREET
jgi:transcriptional regulator